MNHLTRRIGMVALAGALLGAMSGTLEAQLAQGLMRASGKVAVVDVQESLLRLETEPGARQPGTPSAIQPTLFVIDEKTRITESGKPAKLPELEAGEHVTVEYIAQGGRNLARLITIEGPAEATQPVGQPSPTMPLTR